MSNTKKWNVKESVSLEEDTVRGIAQNLDILPVIAMILYNRGFCNIEAAEHFLKKDTTMFHNPFLLTDMDIAVERIRKAILSNENIIIYGDYDVDGVTSVSTLYLYLKENGANIDYYIPSRTGEGYGVNISAIQALFEKGTNLIITVDTGITAINEILYAKKLGIDMIITDHHECRDVLPEAVAVINPRRLDCEYPFKELAGVGVVFKLICAIEKTYNNKVDYMKNLCIKYIDLVCIGTVADVMPLIDENRLIVSIGLNFIRNTKKLGLIALLEASESSSAKNRKITSGLIGFVIAPRINAAGRISSASRAVELFLTDSKQKAQEIAKELCETNKERQLEENNIIEQVNKKIENEYDLKNDLVLVLDDFNWHHGVIGIVSSRITERYNLPSILISFDGNGDIGKGSGRSIKGLNLVNGLVYCKDLLLKYGGHEMAAGLSIERDKLPEFKKRINEYARQNLTQNDLIMSINVDCELQMQDINMKLANELYYLEPFGISNPLPNFLMKNVEIVEIFPIGNNRHTKLILKKDNISINAMYFGVSISSLDFYQCDEVDVVFNIDINDFQNIQTVQIIVKDIDLSEKTKISIDKRKSLYQSLEKDRIIYKDENFVPTHDDFARLYLYIKYQINQANDTMSIRYIQNKLKDLNYVKIKFIISIFIETNILDVDEKGNDIYKFKLNYVKTKISLEKSSIYIKIKNKQQNI